MTRWPRLTGLMPGPSPSAPTRLGLSARWKRITHTRRVSATTSGGARVEDRSDDKTSGQPDHRGELDIGGGCADREAQYDADCSEENPPQVSVGSSTLASFHAGRVLDVCEVGAPLDSSRVPSCRGPNANNGVLSRLGTVERTPAGRNAGIGGFSSRMVTDPCARSRRLLHASVLLHVFEGVLVTSACDRTAERTLNTGSFPGPSFAS